MTRDTASLSAFKGKLIGGGARPNLFKVQLAPPEDLSVQGNAAFKDDRFSFLCKAASLPASNIASIDVPFRGRIFKVAGDRTVENWTVTVINDEDFVYRTAFEDWMQRISRLENNVGVTNPNAYMADAEVVQLGKGATMGRDDVNGKKNNSAEQYKGGAQVASLARYKFQDIWPVNISAIDLSYENSDQIEEFTVEFAVQSYSTMVAKGEGNTVLI